MTRSKLTLVLFDDEYLVPVRSLPVAEVLPLTRETYIPRSMTALLDAVGRTIDELGETLANLPAAKRPAQVIVPILTDGLENASQHFSWPDVARRIKHQTETYNWTFLFLGANQDAIATAAQMSIAAANSATYIADDAGFSASMHALGRKVRSVRHKSMGVASVAEAVEAEAPIADILAEEDRRERGDGGR